MCCYKCACTHFTGVPVTDIFSSFMDQSIFLGKNNFKKRRKKILLNIILKKVVSTVY